MDTVGPLDLEEVSATQEFNVSSAVNFTTSCVLPKTNHPSQLLLPSRAPTVGVVSNHFPESTFSGSAAPLHP